MSKRAAIYARFSSDRQNERSCTDQIALCEAWGARQGLTITASYQDAAVSGASTVNRFGLASLLRDARARRFDIVLCEALDRLSRDQADLARLKKDLAFLDIAIMTVQDGEVGAMHIGLKGLMGEMYLADLAQKTHRGLSARVRNGASGGGRSYGYTNVPGTPGAMTIVDAEAAIVRRIFEAYRDGSSPREIAASLNAERIPAPRGGKWNASTITGSRQRLNGILQNSLYAGEIVWNRQRFIKDPSTGKRVSRLNPESEWVRAAAPELAIVDAATYAAATGRKAERSFAQSNKPVAARPRHILSGLLKCGCCGASYTVMGRDRLGCSGFRERGDCTNNRTVERRHVEERVLDALHNHLADPELLAEFIRAYHERRRERAAAGRKELAALQRRLGEVKRQIDRTVDMLINGDPALTEALTAKMRELEPERVSLTARLAEIEGEEKTIALHPGAAEKYARIVSGLRARVETMTPGPSTDALIEEARKLIDKVVVTPPQKSKEPVDLTVHGLLAELLIGDAGPQYRGALVAGTRNNRHPTYQFAA